MKKFFWKLSLWEHKNNNNIKLSFLLVLLLYSLHLTRILLSFSSRLFHFFFLLFLVTAINFDMFFSCISRKDGEIRGYERYEKDLRCMEKKEGNNNQLDRRKRMYHLKVSSVGSFSFHSTFNSTLSQKIFQ